MGYDGFDDVKLQNCQTKESETVWLYVGRGFVLFLYFDFVSTRRDLLDD